MTAICHYKKYFFGNEAVKIYIKLCANHLVITDVIIHVPETLEANFHEFWLLMLDGKNDRLKDALE